MKKIDFRLTQPAILLLLFIALLSSAALARGENTPLRNGDDDEEDTLDNDTAFADSIISEADLPWPQNVQERIGKLLTADMFETSTVGLMVYDLTADSVLLEHNARQTMRPASTLKMIVAVTALDRLGHDYQYRTRLYVTGTRDSTVLNGDIYCRGGFDPMIDQDDIRTLVDSLQSLGIDTVRGDIFADLSMKDGDRLGEGWCWDDDNPVLSPLLCSRKDNFTDRLMSRLKRAGITVEGSLKEGSTPRSAHLVCTISRPITDVMRRMMKKSDNLYSESVFYQVAASAGSSQPATAKQGRQIVNRLVQKLGLKPSRYYIADGSGLSLYNYVSPELEVCFLRYAYRSSDIYPYLRDVLPIAGTDGTLSGRMRRGYAHGNVHAKTGTVTGVSTLAGYCTAANGHVLCFSIINMGIRHASSGRRFQDRVCEALCRP